MSTVNPYLLSEVLEPLIGLADDDESIASYRSFDANDPVQVKKLTRALLKPAFDRHPESLKLRIKLALRHGLQRPETDFLGEFHAALLPFEAPRDARQFFEWVWLGLFEGESLETEDVRSLEVRVAVGEAIRHYDEARKRSAH